MKLNRTAVMYLTIITIFAMSMASAASAAPGRIERELSGEGWRVWLDTKASWIDDDIYMPPVDVSRLPVNPPTCGWESLEIAADKTVAVPATVEEHFWERNGNPVGEAGDYRGVSWWSTTFPVESTLRGKRITLAFDSVVLRAEVFVNRKLVGYDIIGSTPFSVDITDAVAFGSDNSLDIRITDPAGNFDWNNNLMYRWGKNNVPAYHGFGGITGRVFLRATDAVHVDDVHVRNSPKVTEADVFVTVGNSSGGTRNGTLTLTVTEWKNPSAVLWTKTLDATVPADGAVLSFAVKAPKAKPWNIGDPNLYIASAEFTASDGSLTDTMERRFGFRWFDIAKKDGDEKFYLNGRRVFLFAPMNRGFWPKNGIFPTPDMLARNMETLKAMGFNMFLMNQAIGQEYAIRACDEAGILSYEGIGGYRCDDRPDENAMIWRREKLRRMVMRDRSYASLTIYVMKCETNVPPSDDDKNNMRMAHELDPVRIITYNSDYNRTINRLERLDVDPFKMHIRPNDGELRYYGWWNQHHWVPWPGYIDEYYNNPRFFLRGTVADTDSLHPLDPDEIIFYGEEGAFGSMIRLGKIKEDLDRTGASGWREREHLDWYEAYDRFLDRSGMRRVFPTVDIFTTALGENMHYFHGRILENMRIANVVDGCNLNSWAAGGSRTDLVDMYRHPTADPSIIARYSRPLYVAVKIRNKVLPAGARTIADFFIVNESDIKGRHTLNITLTLPSGATMPLGAHTVTIKGGEDYGQLLVEGIETPTLADAGRYSIEAILVRDGKTVADGSDEIVVADYMHGPGIHGTGAVIDTTGTINAFLKQTRGVEFPAFDPNGPDLDYIIVGPHAVDRRSRGLYGAVMDRVVNGATLIVLAQTEWWAQQMDTHALHYINSFSWRNDGRFFVGEHPILTGLPQGQAMNWEYQSFYKGAMRGIGIDPLGTEMIAGLAATHRKDILSVVSRIPYGNGTIILSTLDIMPLIPSEAPQTAVPKKLLLNMIEYGPRER